MLTRRYARVLAGDRANLLALLAAAPLLGLLQLWRLPSDQFKELAATQFRLVPQASLILLVLAIGMTMMGLTGVAAGDRQGACRSSSASGRSG